MGLDLRGERFLVFLSKSKTVMVSIYEHTANG